MNPFAIGNRLFGLKKGSPQPPCLRGSAAIIPATRFSWHVGLSKQLLPIRRRPAIRWVVKAALDAGVERVVVVLGHRGREMKKALSGMPVLFAESREKNPNMAGFIRDGLYKVPPSVRGVFVLPCVQPLVQPGTFRRLWEVFERDPDVIAVPVHQGSRRHPALFSMRLAQKVFLGKNMGEVMREHSGRILQVPVANEGAALNMDAPPDYGEVRNAAETPSPKFPEQPAERL
ncbi:MAG: nucleotidyltransferase family protein [Deltaproteobacteria bacterium]|nr:nucleotidyltransferase family protein [Deltaproteobacteria bacterium]